MYKKGNTPWNKGLKAEKSAWNKGIHTGAKVDLIGKRFGKLIVVKQCEERDKLGSILWECLCDCGNTPKRNTGILNSGNSTSCGCALKEFLSGKFSVTHGLLKGVYHGEKTPIEYRMLVSTRCRAKKENISFNLDLADIVIPEFCPVFPNIRLCKDNTSIQDNSPSIDKLVPSLGYTKGNIRIISNRANRIKSNATWEEILRVAEWFKGELYARKQ